MQFFIQKYIVEIHTSYIIIEKNHNAEFNCTGIANETDRVEL